MELERRSGETDFEYHKRLVYGKLVDKTLADVDYSELAEMVYGKPYSSDVARRMMYGSKYTIDLVGRAVIDQVTADCVPEITRKIAELQKERAKFQAEKIEYNKWVREEARDELICEHICDAINKMPPLEIPRICSADVAGRVPDNREGCLLIADPHYGVDLKIFGLFGEVINEYSPEIFEQRMWRLLTQVVDICSKEGFSSLNVYDLGDEVDGMLRVSQLFKLRYGVIESTVRYARFMSEWLNELTKYVYVRYQMVKDSNHCQLRLLNQPKNTFKDDNMSHIIAEKFLDRLSENPNFEFIQNPTGYIFDKVAGLKEEKEELEEK